MLLEGTKDEAERSMNKTGSKRQSISKIENDEIKDLDLAALYNESFKKYDEGQVVDGRIVAIREKEVLVDIGYKSEGVVPLQEFSDPSALNVGDVVPVLFENAEDESGMIVISKRKADRIRCWDDIISNYQEGSEINGKIFKKVRGGFMVDIGMEAFLPASLVDIKPTRNLDQFLGLSTNFKIAKINYKRKNIVLSRKACLEEEKKEARTKILEGIKEGQILQGKVKNITDFGGFIDLGGVDGLLHITDMSWGRVSHPSEIVSLGQDIEVMVIGYDEKTQRVSLGLKQKEANPWEQADSKYPVNAKVKGKVVNILPYGAFIELEKGIEGLVHISELSWTKRITHPSEMLSIGDEVEAIILSIDKDAKKIALGLKQTEVNPWLIVEEKYAVGSDVQGTVRNITDYGAFVELEPGIDGLIHISDISWVKKINHPREVFKKSEKITARILSVDKNNRKISLGIKQLTNDPWQELSKSLTPGEVVQGTVTKVVNFGVFVDIKNNLEGLIHVSEIPENKTGSLDQHFKAGAALNVMILKVDVDSRKIALTLKGDIPQEVEAPAQEANAQAGSSGQENATTTEAETPEDPQQ
ncbi:MAG: 30S ribosomal protein S1 [Candidatus Omnitrophica bacterium]|nr:30S ribosomal protein S1 [Candidatus Omnitrophota bacterium]